MYKVAWVGARGIARHMWPVIVTDDPVAQNNSVDFTWSQPTTTRLRLIGALIDIGWLCISHDGFGVRSSRLLLTSPLPLGVMQASTYVVGAGRSTTTLHTIRHAPVHSAPAHREGRPAQIVSYRNYESAPTS